MKKSAAAHLRVLSGMTADPTKVARAMLDTGKKHMKLTRRQHFFDSRFFMCFLVKVATFTFG